MASKVGVQMWCERASDLSDTKVEGYPCPECGAPLEHKHPKQDPYRGVGQYHCPNCSFWCGNTHKVETGEIYEEAGNGE